MNPRPTQYISDGFSENAEGFTLRLKVDPRAYVDAGAWPDIHILLPTDVVTAMTSVFYAKGKRSNDPGPFDTGGITRRGL